MSHFTGSSSPATSLHDTRPHLAKSCLKSHLFGGKTLRCQVLVLMEHTVEADSPNSLTAQYTSDHCQSQQTPPPAPVRTRSRDGRRPHQGHRVAGAVQPFRLGPLRRGASAPTAPAGSTPPRGSSLAPARSSAGAAWPGSPRTPGASAGAVSWRRPSPARTG